MEQQLLRRYLELYPVEGEDLELRERNLRLARDRIVAIEALLKLSTSPAEASVAAPPIMSQQNLVLLEKQRLAERLFVTSAILIPTGTLLALTCGTIFALSGSGPAEVFMAASPGIVAAGTGLVTLSIGIRQSNLARRGVVQIAPPGPRPASARRCGYDSSHRDEPRAPGAAHDRRICCRRCRRGTRECSL